MTDACEDITLPQTSFVGDNSISVFFPAGDSEVFSNPLPPAGVHEHHGHDNRSVRLTI